MFLEAAYVCFYMFVKVYVTKCRAHCCQKMDQRCAWGTDGDKFSILFLFHANTVVFAVEKKYPINRTDVLHMSETGLSRRFCNTLRTEWSITGFSRAHKIGNIRIKYSTHVCSFILYLHQMMLVNVKLDVSGYKRIHFKVAWHSWKEVSNNLHSCIVENEDQNLAQNRRNGIDIWWNLSNLNNFVQQSKSVFVAEEPTTLTIRPFPIEVL